MTNTDHDIPTDTLADGTQDDRPSEVIGFARTARSVLRHPAVWGPVLVLAGFALFGLGQGIGESFYEAFDGDTGAAVVSGAGLLGVVVAVVGLGVLGDRWLASRRDGDETRPDA